MASIIMMSSITTLYFDMLLRFDVTIEDYGILAGPDESLVRKVCEAWPRLFLACRIGQLRAAPCFENGVRVDP